MTKYGEYAPDGSLKQEADECILTGRFVDADNSVREHVPETRFFYRVIQDQYHRVTNHQRGQWRANAPKTAEVPVDMPTDVRDSALGKTKGKA